MHQAFARRKADAITGTQRKATPVQPSYGFALEQVNEFFFIALGMWNRRPSSWWQLQDVHSGSL
jgi:hypothetical protein